VPPVSVALDLDLSDDDIHRLIEQMVGTPGHMLRALRHEPTRGRMIEEGTIEHR
jgi:hypothetical protein